MKPARGQSPRPTGQWTRFAPAVCLALALSALTIESTWAGTLSTVSPGGATPGITLTILGSGFNTTAANDLVTFTPAAGAAASALAKTVTTIDASTGLRRITVAVPDGLPIGTTALRVTNTATGEISQGASFELLGMSLSGATTGASGSTGVQVAIQGSPNAAFVAGGTKISFGAGLTLTALTVDSPTLLHATLSIAATAALGPRTLSVSTSTQTLALLNGFTVTAAPTNVAPTVSAGANITITLPTSASLSGVVTDDGLPTGAAVTSVWTKFSGPGTVTFGNAATPATSAAFSLAGTYVLRLTASDTLLSASSDVTITVNPAIVTPPTNLAPTVTAGANATITLPATAALSGVVTDDGLPSGATVTSAWTKFSGPGTVTFANAASAVTTATFDVAGTYVLRLMASDTLLSASSDVTITVNPAIVTPPTNLAPTVTAGANATITLPASASLSGVVTDDGLPSGATVTSAWTKFSGPGTVTFANAASAVTTATFDVAGTYVLRLTASDSLLSAFSDTTITVNNPSPTNHSPIARPGGPYSGATGVTIAFDGSLSSDPDADALSFAWSFGDGTTGAGAQPNHTYATADQFTVTLTVSDGHGGSNAATAIASVAQTNRPPTASAGGPYTGDAGAPIGFAASASDPDQDALTFGWDFGDGSQASGRSPSHVYASSGTFTLTLSVSDGHGGAITALSTATVGPAVDRAPPVVKLSAATTALPGTQTVVTAQANDNVGVTSVSFDVDGASTSQTTTVPYLRTVDIPALAAPGTVIKVKATARDAANNVGTDQIAITIAAAPDTTPPTVTIQLPPQASPGSTIVVSAIAADAGGVQRLTFSSAGVPFATDSTSPYSVQFVIPPDTAPGSSLTFVARALDFANNFAESTGQVPIVATPDTQPPTVTLSAPASVVQGGALHLTATAADNVQVASVDFLLDDVVVGTAIAAPFSSDAASSRPPGSVLRVRALAKDSSGNQAFSDRETRVISPAATGAAGVLAGRVYDDTTGLPVADASVALVGADANDRPYSVTGTTDSRGLYFLNASSGHGTLQIGRAGWTRVDRPIDVPDIDALSVFDARLTPLSAAAPSVPSIVGGTVQAGDARLAITSGGLAVDTALAVTTLGQQGLEGVLPFGWSPAGVVDVTPHGVAFTAPQSLSLANLLKLPAGTTLIVATWDEAAAAWRAVGTTSVAGDASQLDASIVSSGQYAWLVADAVPAAPPLPGVGALLDGVARTAVPDPASIHITPQPRVVFYKPGVNSTVGAVLDSPLPSGTPLRSHIVESYAFTSTDEARPDPFAEDLVFYQRPGPAASVSAGFIVTPSLTFDPLDLRQGLITVELRAPSDVTSKPSVGIDGGLVGAATGETLQVAANAFSTRVPIDLESLTFDALGLTLPPGLSFIGGVTVGFSGATPGSPAVLSIPRPAQFDGASSIVLLRLSMIEGKTRLLMVGIGRVVGTRIVSDAVLPGAAAILDGVTAPGRYVFVRGTTGLAFATGVITGSDGRPLARALVSSAGLPIVALSDALGRYVVPVGLGAVTITAKDLQKQDTQTIQRAVANAGSVVPADVPLSVLSLTLTSLTPAEGSTSVALSAAVVATFSAPIDPATLIGPSASGIVVKTLAGSVVPGAITLSAGNSRATFRPSSLLAPNGSYTATISTDVKDLAGRPLSAAATTHFTSLDTTPPFAPAAGSITATIPDGSGFTIVTGAQGTAGTHDTVSIVNKTKKTSFPALVNANGGFSATFAVSLGDQLQVAITDQSGNQTVVALPAFTRTNADGSIATVVGAAGGRLLGPAGIAVDVPANAFADGTIVTVGSVAEPAFPIQLTEAQKQFFGFSGGVTLDFGGATPSTYLNVSIPTVGGETDDDRWIVGQVMTVAGQPLFNIADTARVIDGRITTSSPPCPGVQAAATYGFVKSVQRPVGVNYGRILAPNPGILAAGLVVASMSQPIFGLAGAAAVSLPFALLATPTPVDVCLPVLSGRVTVQPNSQRIIINADQFTPLDREIIVRNQRLGSDFHFPRNVAEYRFVVDGARSNSYKVTAVADNGTELPIGFKVLPASPGTVNVVLNITQLNFPVLKVIVKNVTTGVVREFPQSTAEVKLAVDGGADDGFEVDVVDVDGRSRSVAFTNESTAGTGNLVARALPVTIDPGTDVFLQRLDKTDGHVIDGLLIPQSAREVDGVELGGFTFPFDGDPAHETFQVMVVYSDGRPPDTIWIPSVEITLSDPATGKVISTISALVPPQDEPFNLGTTSTDHTPPTLTTSPPSLAAFDATTPLTFTFNEGIDRASALKGFTLLDELGRPVGGQVRLSNQNRTLTFVPDAPLRLNARYTVNFKDLADGSGNRMAAATYSVATLAPSLVPSGPVPSLTLMQSLQFVYEPGDEGTTRTLAYGITGDTGELHSLVVLDVTRPATPVLLSTTPIGDGGRVTVVTGVTNLATREPNECGGGTTFSGDLAIVSTFDVGSGSAVRFFDVTEPSAPCLLGAKLLTFNPAIGSVQGVVLTSMGFARGVATLSEGDRRNAYIAVENVGLMLVDVGNHIPPVPADQRVREAMVAGNYTDVLAVKGRLLAIERTRASLDTFSAGLAQVSSTGILLNDAISLAYSESVPIDLDHDGEIGQDEIRDLAFVGGTGGVTIVDVTEIDAPVILGLVPMDASIYSLDFDPEHRRLYAGGASPAPAGAFAVFLIDLSAPSPFGAIDKDLDGVDDRIVWRSSPGTGSGRSNYRAVRFDSLNKLLYVGTPTGVEVYRSGTQNLRGTATFTFIPTVFTGSGPTRVIALDYANQAPKAIRGAIVELRDATGRVLQTTNTDDNGSYAFVAPVGISLEVVVKAALGAPDQATLEVVDNTSSNKLYTKSSGPFLMPGTLSQDIYAETVWAPATAPARGIHTKREAAPFAILDMAYQAQQSLRAVDPAIKFPHLFMAWSAANQPAGPRNVASGLIETSHYMGDEGTLYILGAENVDTDEYDAQVVLHEWSHYFLDKFSRDDTPGGTHNVGDVLDPRASFSEGFATAFASMLTNNPLYVDTRGVNQASGFGRNIEVDRNPSTGFFSEDSVEEVLWDLFDGIDVEPDAENPGTTFRDDVQLGLKPIYDALINASRTTPAFATIYSFLNAVLGSVDSATRANIVALAASEAMDIANADTFEQFTAGSAGGIQIGRLYTPVPVGIVVSTFGPGTPLAGQSLATRIVNDTRTPPDGNKLDEYVFFKFTTTTAGQYVVTVTPTDNKAVYVTVNQRGVKTFSSGIQKLGTTQSVTVTLFPGTYVAAVTADNLVAGARVPSAATFTISVAPK